MNMMRFRYFLEVAGTRSITAAAKNCYISQTAMSQQIDALEQELGVRLFTRTRTGTELTEAGAYMLPRAESLLNDYDALLGDMAAHFGGAGKLTVAYTGPLEQDLLRRAIPIFCRQHPETAVAIRQYSMATIGTALQKGQCDIALVIPTEAPIKRCVQVDVMSRPIYAAVAEESPLAQQNSVARKDLIRYPVVLLRAEGGMRVTGVITDWLLSLGWKKEQILHADTIENQLLMVQLGQGISFMPLGQAFQGIRLLPVEDINLQEHHTHAAMLDMTPIRRAFVRILRQESGLEQREA